MKTTTAKLLDTSTPFLVLSLPGNVELRQYSTKGGTYGHQVVTVVFNYQNILDHTNDVFEHKTSGCGYCKKSHGLNVAFEHLGYQPKGHRKDGWLPYDLYVGGNFYKCTEIEAL
jgi:hypothetical protein